MRKTFTLFVWYLSQKWEKKFFFIELKVESSREKVKITSKQYFIINIYWHTAHISVFEMMISFPDHINVSKSKTRVERVEIREIRFSTYLYYTLYACYNILSSIFIQNKRQRSYRKKFSFALFSNFTTMVQPRPMCDRYNNSCGHWRYCSDLTKTGVKRV